MPCEPPAPKRSSVNRCAKAAPSSPSDVLAKKSRRFIEQVSNSVDVEEASGIQDGVTVGRKGSGGIVAPY